MHPERRITTRSPFKAALLSSAVLLSAAWSAPAESAPSPGLLDSLVPGSNSFVKIVPRAEVGWAAVLQHVYQSGSNATRFDFTKAGGQDTLFPFVRVNMDLVLFDRNVFTLLYQPLTLSTKTVVNRNNVIGGALTIDDAVFPSGTPVDIVYGFDFWRLSYMFDFLKAPESMLAAGISLQLRNASISFTSTDGKIRTISQNIGPVPILKFRVAHWFSPLFGLDLEADGFYAAGAGFNGATKPFEGWIWDVGASVKTRFAPRATGFVTLRTIGGGANGNNAYSYVSSTTTVNSYTYNSLATMALSLGVSIE